MHQRYQKYCDRHGLTIGMRIAYLIEYKDRYTQQWLTFERTGTITGFSSLTVSFKQDPPLENDKWSQYLYKTGDKKGVMLLTTPMQCISLARLPKAPKHI